jgi:hypothetical protein
MEHENKNQTETALIDIFYKDTERLNSIISQINKGTLQSLTTKSEDLQGSTFYSGGKVGIPGSGLECNQQSKEENKKIIEENRLIQDFSVIDLLQTLDLEVIDSVTNDMLADLVILEGSLKLQNYKAISNAMPLLTPYYQLFESGEDLRLNNMNIELTTLKKTNPKTTEIRNKIKSLESEISTYKHNYDVGKKIISFMPNILPFLPKGLGFEITLKNNLTFNGVLKDKYLIDSEEIILTTYNTNLPGYWKILGIIDSIDDATESKDLSNPINAINNITTFFKKMLSPNPIKGIIKPILIFRDLNLK